MTLSIFLYIFGFSTWAVGILSWLIILGGWVGKRDLEMRALKIEVQQKEFLYKKFTSLSEKLSGGMPPFPQPPNSPGMKTPWGNVSDTKPSKELIPDKIMELMQSSPNHPEVNEIDSSDQILGVRFEAKDYPPVFGDEDE